MYSLVGKDRTSHSIISYVKDIMRENNYPEDEIKSFCEEAVSSTFQYLISKSVEMVENINERIHTDSQNCFSESGI